MSQAPKNPAEPKPNAPQGEADAAHRSGQFGADEPRVDKQGHHPKRESDKAPNKKGPGYEEGGQYPGKRQEGT